MRFLDVPGAPELFSVDPLLLPGVADVNPPDKGLGGRLEVLTPPRGGCGKAFMLMVFLMVFPAAFTPGVVRNFGSVVCELDAEGRPDVEGARSPLFGKLGGVLSKLDTVGIAPVLFRVFVEGKAGRAVVGGPYDGLEGLGIAAAMTKTRFEKSMSTLSAQY